MIKALAVLILAAGALATSVFPPPPPTSCAVVLCAKGYVCIEQTIFCVTTPCPGKIAKCVPVKPGFCPRRNPDIFCTAIFRPDLCQQDNDCKGNHKCCRAQCGNKVCTPPVFENCSQLKCRKGFRCVQDNIVCVTRPCFQNPRCVPIKPVRPKPGVCPARNPIPCTKQFRPPLCFKDSDCPRRQKCCLSDCGQKICRDPIRNRVCQLPKRVGPCDNDVPRYYYNKLTHRCQKFSYGGCKGNKNNFKSLAACLQTCGDVCSLPKVVGRCRARIPRYFFNSVTKKCELFYYGGCGGNGNNFKTLYQCKRTCPRRGHYYTY